MPSEALTPPTPLSQPPPVRRERGAQLRFFFSFFFFSDSLSSTEGGRPGEEGRGDEGQPAPADVQYRRCHSTRPPRYLACVSPALLLAAALPAGAVDARDVLGVAHAGGRYNFTGEDFLNEGADRILELRQPGDQGLPRPRTTSRTPTPSTPTGRRSPVDVVELVQRPYVQELFAKPFSTFLLVITPVTGTPQFLDGLSADEAAAESDQMYRLAKYLLTTYAGHAARPSSCRTGRGTTSCYQGLAAGAQPDPVRVQGMIDWWNARQAGVDQARQEVGAHDVEVLHAAEVNFLQRGDGRQGDGDQQRHPVHPLRPLLLLELGHRLHPAGSSPAALDYLKSKAPDSARFGRDDVYLGEFGVAKDGDRPSGQRFERIRELMEAALGWGVRYAVYWQVYCNEAVRTYTGRPSNDDLRGYWLIRPDGVKAPMLGHPRRSSSRPASTASP